MSSRPSLPPATALAASAACALLSPAHAGVVGRDASLLWTGAGETIDQRSFTIEEDLVEYSWTISSGSSWAAFSLDLNEKGLRLVYDCADQTGTVAPFNFGSNAIFRIDLPADVLIDLALVGNQAGVDGFAPGDVEWKDNRLLLDVSQVALTGDGAMFEVEYFTSAVPAPGAAALVALAARRAGRRRE